MMNENIEISTNEILPEESENQQPNILADSTETNHKKTVSAKKQKNILTTIIIILLILIILILSILLCAEKFNWNLWNI